MWSAKFVEQVPKLGALNKYGDLNRLESRSRCSLVGRTGFRVVGRTGFRGLA